jgi:hypothetical protein
MSLHSEGDSPVLVWFLSETAAAESLIAISSAGAGGQKNRVAEAITSK